MNQKVYSITTGADLRAWRKKLGLTQTAAAELIGITQPHLSDLETGKEPIRKTLGLACEGAEARLMINRGAVNS